MPCWYKYELFNINSNFSRDVKDDLQCISPIDSHQHAQQDSPQNWLRWQHKGDQGTARISLGNEKSDISTMLRGQMGRELTSLSLTLTPPLRHRISILKPLQRKRLSKQRVRSNKLSTAPILGLCDDPFHSELTSARARVFVINQQQRRRDSIEEWE
jgi:hypothetical protein